MHRIGISELRLRRSPGAVYERARLWVGILERRALTADTFLTHLAHIPLRVCIQLIELLRMLLCSWSAMLWLGTTSKFTFGDTLSFPTGTSTTFRSTANLLFNVPEPASLVRGFSCQHSLLLISLIEWKGRGGRPALWLLAPRPTYNSEG